MPCAAEIIKRRIMGLHQDTEIGSVDITDTWEPLEEGLNRLETTRHVSVITITLSTAPLDTTSVGYQPPIEDDLVKPLQESGAGSSSRMRKPGRSAARRPGHPALHRHSRCVACFHPPVVRSANLAGPMADRREAWVIKASRSTRGKGLCQRAPSRTAVGCEDTLTAANTLQGRGGSSHG